MRLTKLRRLLRRLSPLALAGCTLAGLAACDDAPLTDISIRPNWTLNQEFHLETRYQQIEAMTEAGDRAFDIEAFVNNEAGNEFTMDAADRWSEPVYWRYQVIEQGLQPAEGDDFFEFSSMGGSDSALTVIKASLDPQLNLDSPISEVDPTIYMVIREDRLRLVGLVSFWTNGESGERESESLSIDPEEVNRSYSRLSQTSHSLVPNLIPPFPIAAIDRDMVLEDGQLASFANATDSSVEVTYEDSMDGSLIAERWEDGQPWATLSVTNNVESRLMDPTEVSELQRGLPAFFDENDDAEDLSYVELLKQPLRLTDAFMINSDMLGTNTYEVSTGNKPWAGSWWPQRSGKLVFGYLDGEHNTISQLAKERFVPLGTAVQDMGNELRDLRKDGQGSSDEYNGKLEEYRTAQNDFVQGMVTFYNEVRAAIDGGRILVEDGRISGDAGWNELSGDDAGEYFDLDIDRLSPMDKFALAQQLNGQTQGTNPWFVSAWELLNHWSPNANDPGTGWYGHCNGWAAAAILANEPTGDITVEAGSQEMIWTSADQKGLTTESHYSQTSHFWGTRYGDEEDNLADLTPPAVLKLLNAYVRDRGVALVFDITAEAPVWNYPAWKYDLILNETTTGGAAAASGLININTAAQSELETLWGISTVRGQRVIEYRQTHGPFQSIEEIIDVNGIGRGIFNRIQDLITVDDSSALRTFEGSFVVTLSTDGVLETHVDNNPENPNSQVETWDFTMTASPSGEVISGEWDDNTKHPDFAWAPYLNTVRSGRSENAYLYWPHLKAYMPGHVRQ